MSEHHPHIIRPEPLRPFAHVAPPSAVSDDVSVWHHDSFDDGPTGSLASIFRETLPGSGCETSVGDIGVGDDNNNNESLSDLRKCAQQLRQAELASSSQPSSPPPSSSSLPTAAADTRASTCARVLALFGFGVMYGVFIAHLHENSHVATAAATPAAVRSVDDILNGTYCVPLVFWGLAGVALGSALPWVDVVWEGRQEKMKKNALPCGGAGRESWNDVVRSVGAFVGIAFAIRKLQWQSTTQISLTLALVSPALWYLLDRSKPGFTLSMLVGLAGTAVMLLLGQHADRVAFIPSPPVIASSSCGGGIGSGSGLNSSSAHAVAGASSASADHESTVGVAAWFASVLFCSCVCFGNIGRKLAARG